MDSKGFHSDKALTDSLKLGDAHAFEIIYSKYWDKLYYVAYRLLKDEEACEEILQDVFVLLWHKRTTLTINSLPVYLAAMVRYSVYGNLAKEKQKKIFEDHHLYQEQQKYLMSDDIENKLLLEIINDLSNRLPEKCALVFRYNKLQDMPLAKVAELLNISTKTAEAHLTKALKLIRANIGNSFHLLF